jgi:uncharacterized protein
MLADPLPWWTVLAYGLGLGLVWTSAHCAGMCGPIVLALRLHAPELTQPSTRLFGIALRLGGYQMGRLIIYALLGVTVGALGSVIIDYVALGTEIMGWLLGVSFICAALWQLFKKPSAISPDSRPPLATRLAMWVLQRAPNQPFLRAFVLGLGMAALPCGIVFWALGLATATAQPLAGGLLMASLVIITTPALVGVAISPMALAAAPLRFRAWLQRWAGRWLAPIALGMSGIIILTATIARHMGESCPHCG